MKFKPKNFAEPIDVGTPWRGVTPDDLSRITVPHLSAKSLSEDELSMAAQKICESLNLAIKETNDHLNERNYAFSVDIHVDPSKNCLRIEVLTPKELPLPLNPPRKYKIEKLPAHLKYMQSYASLRLLYHLHKNLPKEFLDCAQFEVGSLSKSAQTVEAIYDQFNYEFPQVACDFLQEVETLKGNAGPSSRLPKTRAIAQVEDLTYPVPPSLGGPIDNLPTISLYGGWALREEGLSFTWFTSEATAEAEIGKAFPREAEDSSLEASKVLLIKAVEGAKEFLQKRQIDYSLAELVEEDGKVLRLSFGMKQYPLKDSLTKDQIKPLREGTKNSAAIIRSVECAFEVLKQFLSLLGKEEASNYLVQIPPLFGDTKIPAEDAYTTLRKLTREGLACLTTDLYPPPINLQEFRENPSLMKRNIAGVNLPEDPYGNIQDSDGLTIYGGYVKETRTRSVGKKTMKVEGLYFRWFSDGSEALKRVQEAFPEDLAPNEADLAPKTLNLTTNVDPTISEKVESLSSHFGNRTDFLSTLKKVPANLEELEAFVSQVATQSQRSSDQFRTHPSSASFVALVERFELLSLMRSLLMSHGGKGQAKAKEFRELSDNLEAQIKRGYNEEVVEMRAEVLDYHKALEEIRRNICGHRNLSPTRFTTESATLLELSQEEIVKNIIFGDEKVHNVLLKAFEFWEVSPNKEPLIRELQNLFGDFSSEDPFIDVLRSIALRFIEIQKLEAQGFADKISGRLATLEGDPDMRIPFNILVGIVESLNDTVVLPSDTKTLATKYKQGFTSSLHDAERDLRNRTPPNHVHDDDERNDPRLKLYFRSYDKVEPLRKQAEANELARLFMRSVSMIFVSFRDSYT